MVHRRIVESVVMSLLSADTQSLTDMDNFLTSHEENMYKQTTENGDKLNVTNASVTSQMSFRIVFRSVQIARRYEQVSTFHSVNKGLVRQFEQTNVSISLEGVRHLICDKRFWAYSVAFNASNNRDGSYIDVCLRCYAR